MVSSERIEDKQEENTKDARNINERRDSGQKWQAVFSFVNGVIRWITTEPNGRRNVRRY